MSRADQCGARLADLAVRFTIFVEHEFVESSQLYAILCRGIAADRDLLALAAKATHTPVTKLFLSAVHYLLLRDPTEPLAAYFPDLAADPDPGDPMPALHTFCRAHRDDLIAFMQTKLVQTNEATRCALWLPAVTLITDTPHS